MIVTFWKGIFVADSLDEKGALKRAGFEPHEPTMCNLKSERCKACDAKIGRRWWTNKIEAATRLREFCNDRALKVMKQHLELLNRSRATDADIKIPSPEGDLDYLPYQKAGVAYALQRKDTLIADEPGLGKTIQALGFVNATKSKNVLVICPNTIVFNWRNEAETWLVGYQGKIFSDCKKTETLPDGDLFVIVNYDKLTRGSKLLDSILARSWDVLVVDEAHYIKNPESARSRVFFEPETGILSRAHRTLYMTGTPIENYPREIWPIAAATCPAKFGDWWAFAKRYCGAHKEPRKFVDKEGKTYTKDVWVTDGATNLPELQQRLRTTFMVRRLKKDVLPELPPKRRQLVLLRDEKVDWSKDPRFKRWQETYGKQYDDVIARLEASKTDEEYRDLARQLDQVTGIAFTEMSVVRHEVAQAKLPLAIQYLDHILASGTKNLVVFAHHRDVIDELVAHFGNDAAVVHGGTPQKGPRSREEAVAAFQAGRKKIFIGQTRAAGVGITLTAADTIVFVEVDWVPGVITQCEDRLCRIGQKKMVHVVHLVLAGTMEVNMIQKIIKKQDIIDRALDKIAPLKLKNRAS